MKRIFMFVNVDWFFLSHRLPIAKSSIRNSVEMFVYTDFTNNINNSVSNIIGISELMASRISYLQALNQFTAIY